MVIKKCVICGKDYQVGLQGSGNSKYCVECRRQHKLALKRIDSKKYYQKNRDKILAWSRWYEKTFKKKRQETYQKYRNTDKYRKYSRERYYKTDPNKRRAHYYVKNAIRDGKLVKLDYCQNCGVNDQGEKRSMIESHHYIDYKPDNWLKVRWLCVPCHKKADKEMMRNGES